MSCVAPPLFPVPRLPLVTNIRPSVGDPAELRVDSFPGQVFTAAVTRIADQAEYTPQNVQTQQERQTTVYAVELSLANLDGRLKPGMPADVTFPNAGN